jgi:hypothetical protein
MGEPSIWDQAGHGVQRVSDACADLNTALPELTIADDPGGHAASGEEAP